MDTNPNANTQSGKSTLVQRLDALYEYDREPVSEKKLHGWKTYIAMLSGEHIAGTEFVLGVLMFMHGVSARDFFLGLFIGNLLAVLSWAFICAPIGVKTRLTIYWQLRKSFGPYITVAYSAVYAIILCLLSGAMVNVAVTAVSIPFNIPNPDFMAGDIIPSFPWILLAIFVGAVIAILAVLGFKKIAHFSKICAPWMVFVFLAAALAVLADLGVHKISDFWPVATKTIFPGIPQDGYSKYTLWHVIGFAWLCNATQHIGVADITIFRYAKKWTQGFASAFGMYLGHFGAWICSGILCSAYYHAGNVNPQAGDIAYFGAGIAGAICVVIAGWSTANPGLYRAGLAIQVVTPNWKRWKVTFVAGLLMIIAACIPAVTAYLDRIVGYIGLFLLPLGACVFIDIWVLPKLGMISDYTNIKKLLISWPAAATWILSFLFSIFLYSVYATEKGDLMFLILPEWIIAMVLYLVFSIIQQKIKRNN
ncbi:purine-cytosine permease family protein [Bacteroidota bacterium]